MCLAYMRSGLHRLLQSQQRLLALETQPTAVGNRQEHSRDTCVAHLTFVVRDQVPNAAIPINPLGLTVTYLRVDQAFR